MRSCWSLISDLVLRRTVRLHHRHPRSSSIYYSDTFEDTRPYSREVRASRDERRYRGNHFSEKSEQSWDRRSDDEVSIDDGDGETFAIWIPTPPPQRGVGSDGIPGADGGSSAASKARIQRAQSSPRLFGNSSSALPNRRHRKRLKSKSLPGPGVSWGRSGSSSSYSTFFLYPVDEDRPVLSPPKTHQRLKKTISSNL
jgi:hypothetical protein